MKMQGGHSALLRVFLLSLLGATNVAGEEAQSAPPAGGLGIDPSPAICFLELDFHGELGTFRYSFLGDGRVNIDTFLNSGDLHPADRWRAQLTNAELQAIVSDLVESELYAFDPEAQLERERQEGIRRPLVVDGGWVEVGVSLIRRPTAGKGATEVVARHFGLSAELTLSMPSWLRSPGEHPVIPEVEAYRRIAALATEVRQRATRAEVPPQPGDFSFPPGREPVVVVTSRGTQLPVTTSLTVYSSGTAVIESSLGSHSAELTLSAEEKKRILNDISGGGLAEYDEKALVAQQKRLGTGPLTGTGADSELPVLSVEFRVVKERGTGQAPEALSRTIVLLGATGLAAKFPGIREYRALADLEEFLADVVSRTDSSRR